MRTSDVRRAVKEVQDKLVNGTIVGVLHVDGVKSPGGYGFQVLMPDGKVRNVWVESDETGRRPGRLSVHDLLQTEVVNNQATKVGVSNNG